MRFIELAQFSFFNFNNGIPFVNDPYTFSMRVTYTIGVLLFLNTQLILAQSDQVGIRFGMNASTFRESVNDVSEYKAGFNAGLYYKADLRHNFFFRSELFYSGQGQLDGRGNLTTVTSLNYLNFPLLLEYGKKVSFLVGPQIGFLLSAHKNGNLNASDNLKTSMHDGDIGIVVGTNVQLNKTLHAGLRLNQGISEIFLTRSGTQNVVLNFYLGVLLKSELVR